MRNNRKVESILKAETRSIPVHRFSGNLSQSNYWRAMYLRDKQSSKTGEDSVSRFSESLGIGGGGHLADYLAKIRKNEEMGRDSRGNFRLERDEYRRKYILVFFLGFWLGGLFVIGLSLL